MILLIRKRMLLYTWLAVCMIGLSAIFLAGSRRAFTPTGAMRQGSRVQTVVIDPGHGGFDPGAIGMDTKVVLYYEDEDETEEVKIVTSIRGNSLAAVPTSRTVPAFTDWLNTLPLSPVPVASR